MLERDGYGAAGYERAHQFDRQENRWYCHLCRRTWKRKPDSFCAGVPVYRYGAWPPELYTYTQLRRDMHMRPLNREEPDGAYFLRKSPYRRWLYSVERSVPRRRITSAKQQEAVARMREGFTRRYTCQRCQYYDQSHGKQKYAREIRQGWCSYCWDDYERYELKLEQQVWARKYREQGSFVVLDSETTGLELSDEVLELGIVDGHTGEVLFNSLIQPEDMHRDGLATHIHGITREMLFEAPRFPDVWPEIQKILDQRRVLVYNADFDFGMVRQTAKRYGYSMPDGFRYWECLMHQYSRYHGAWSNYWHGYGWCKLDQACRDLEVVSDASHRALADAKRALGVLNGMADREPVWDGVKPELKPMLDTLALPAGFGQVLQASEFEDHPF